MNLDPLDVLTFCMQANRRAYALLLGSGISSSAGIPTGWEVVQQLCRRLARSRQEDAGADPEGWFERKFERPPTYSVLLRELAPSKAERQALLRGFFEPTAEERENKQKVPTAAHHAIASLAAAGHLRVILTTNFDRLLEQALQSIGVTYVVVSTSDGIAGLTLPKVPLLVLKLHGDYLDTRLKNTPEELASYDPRLRRALRRIFEDYGLLIVGWSAQWDPALRQALSRAGQQRLTVFWTARGPLGPEADQLIALKRATVIPIADADLFLRDLSGRLQALDSYSQAHPISKRIATQMAKRYLSESKHRIALEDLVLAEVEKAYKSLAEMQVSLIAEITKDAVLDRIQRYQSAVETLQALMIVGGYWAEGDERKLWSRSLERLANPPEPSGAFNDFWNGLRSYPALLVLYSCGIAAVAARNFRHLRTILTEPRSSSRDHKGRPLLELVNPMTVMDPRIMPIALEVKYYTPGSEHLYSVLREPMREILSAEERYEQAFDQFELILALAATQSFTQDHWIPLGRFFRKLRLRLIGPLIEDLLTGTDLESTVIAEFFHNQQEPYQGALARIQQNADLLSRTHW
jgi:tetratricopeptide (TPR) repeat protein